jgi:hypothetical protein
MSKTTSCEHGTDTFEFTCTWCLEDENESLRAEVETLKAERDAALIKAKHAESMFNDPERRAYTAENLMMEIERELDRLGAPKLQPSGFGYAPIGRLRALNATLVGEYYGSTIDILKAERDAALAENKRLISRITDKAIRNRRT